MKLQARHPSLLFNDVGRDYFAQLLTACSGGEDSFRSKYLPVAERLACVVQDLPLEKSAFAYQGGALQFGLLAGLTALRLSDGVVFDPSATAQRRMVIEPQFRYAAWCAVLAGVPLIVHHHANISVKDKPWSFASHPSNLFEACDKTGPYSIEWRPPSANPVTSSLAFALLHDFFHAGQFSEFDTSVLTSMCNSVNPGMSTFPGETALSRIVRISQEKVRAAELVRLSKVFAPGDAKVTLSPVMQILQAATDAAIKAPVAPGVQTEVPAVAKPKDSSSQNTTTETDQATGEIKEVMVPLKIAFWVRALIADSEMAKQFQFLKDTGMVDVSVDQLKFGGTAKAMFALLEEAGFVHSKIAGQSLRLNKPLTDFIKKEFEAQGVKHA